MTDLHFIKTAPRIETLILIALGGFVLATDCARGQEVLRLTTASDQAAAAHEQEENAIGYYNLLLGTASFRVTSGLEGDYNSNVTLDGQNPQGDFVFRPNSSMQMNWPITQLNNLNLNFAAGYSAYVQHQNLDQFFVSPGSGLSFNIYAGDFVINLHDQLSISENSYQNQAAGGNTIYSTMQNTAGLSTMWNLNKIETTVGYDHSDYLVLESSESTPNAASENFYVNAGMRPAPEILAGLEAGGGFVDYSTATSSNTVPTPNATQWNLGAFCTATISEYISARMDIGYTALLPDSTSTNYSSSASSGYYLQLLLAHRVNQFFNYTFTASKSVDLEYSGLPYERYDVRLQPVLTLFNKYTIGTPFWWEHGREIYYQSASYDQYGAGITVGRQITEKLSASLSYQYIKEDSDQQPLNYTNQIVSLSFTYQF